MISPGTPSAGTGGAAARHGGRWCRSVVFLGTLSVYPAPPQLLETFWRGPPSASGPGAFPVAGAALVACGWHMLALDDVGVRVAPQQPCPEGGRPGWETGLEPLQYRVLAVWPPSAHLCFLPPRRVGGSGGGGCGQVHVLCLWFSSRRTTWAEERKLNTETFGVSGRLLRGRSFRGGFRGGRGNGTARRNPTSHRAGTGRV